MNITQYINKYASKKRDASIVAGSTGAGALIGHNIKIRAPHPLSVQAELDGLSVGKDLLGIKSTDELLGIKSTDELLGMKGGGKRTPVIKRFGKRGALIGAALGVGAVAGLHALNRDKK